MAITTAQYANGTQISFTTGGDFTVLKVQGIGALGESYASETVTPLDGAVARDHEYIISKRAQLKTFQVTFFFKAKYPPTFNDDTITLIWPDAAQIAVSAGVVDTEFGSAEQDGVMLCTATFQPTGETYNKTEV